MSLFNFEENIELEIVGDWNDTKEEEKEEILLGDNNSFSIDFEYRRVEEVEELKNNWRQ